MITMLFQEKTIKTYYECHITMLGDPAILKPLVIATKWKFSAIDGDANLGDGLKCYATKQLNAKIPSTQVLASLHEVADQLESQGIEILRRKIEMVLYDDKISKVCTGACIDCHLDDYAEMGKICQ